MKKLILTLSFTIASFALFSNHNIAFAHFEKECSTSCEKQDIKCQPGCNTLFLKEIQKCKSDDIPKDCKATAQNNFNQCQKVCRTGIVSCLEKCVVVIPKKEAKH